jgi:hypothetical protein
VAALAFLPLAELLDAGIVAPDPRTAVMRWATGTGFVLLVSLAAAAASSRFQDRIPRARVLRRLDLHPMAAGAGMAACATVLFAVLSHVVFDALPLYVDELTQVRQANIFLSGRLTAPMQQPPEFFSSLLMVEQDGGTFSQFRGGLRFWHLASS